MEKKTILIADDEERIVNLIKDFLLSASFSVLTAFDGKSALNIAQNEKIDLAIIDIMMPELNGWEVTREIRKFSDIPIIILSARSEEFDMLEGFGSGADEYVTKPFSPAVLVKRVEALLKRSEKMENGANKKGLDIDEASFTAFLDGAPLELTLKEFKLLCTLYKNKGLVLSRDQLIDAVWNYDFDGDNRTVDSHIARLRTKLGVYGAANLKTIYGMGYKLDI
ncbi:MAG: response regulator transcription factor [Clostridia bacterium]|nr:response regulator transcription factor [Clostridia bacterium]